MKRVLVLLFLSASALTIFAQEDQPKKPEKPKPVRFTFGTGVLIDNQTVATPYKGGIELQIQHRFSPVKNYHDLFGIYGSANTRIGLNYGVTDRLMIGAGTTRDYKLQDLQWKYLILQQNDDNSEPVSLSYYGNLVVNLQKSATFGPEDHFREIHRLSYFSQLIVARKFNKVLSLQLAPSFVYFNAVPQYSDDSKYNNLNFGLSAGARARLFGSHSVMVEYDQLLTRQELDEQPKPNLAFGWEINTPTHTFQIFATNYSMIVNQQNLLFNVNNFAKGDYLIGFNITVRF
jgi:hypothetical protein